MKESQLKSSDSAIAAQSQCILEENRAYDLAIVGSGISCTYTLIHYLYLLSKNLYSIKDFKSKAKTIRVAIIDKSGEFWTGIAYGKRSGQQSLIITPLKEFLPQPERDRFIAWLEKNYDSVLDNLQQREGLLSKEWLKLYKEAIDFGNWNDLFIPRYLFGWYLQERVANLLQQTQNYLRCDLITADVCNISKRLKSYQLDTTEGKSAMANKVVLAIGSPPNKVTFIEKSEFLQLSSQDKVCCIANMYEPNQTSNLTKISNCLQANSDRTKYPNQVLIIGSNASALETIYSLNNLPQVANSIDKFIIVSPSGAFPHRITDSPTSSTYVAKNLQLLLMRSNFTAKQIYQAVKQDVRIALDNNETIDSTYPIVSREVIKALNRLEHNEQKEFVIKYGVKIGKFQRRAGIDYLNVVDKLMFEGKLEFIKGKFIGIMPISDGNFGFKFVTPISEQPQLYTNPVRIIINCAGFQDLTKSSSPLINSLIQQGICTPNDSKCGFEINENFEAQQNLYLMGPLIAGNINDRFKVWHAESCGRIFNFSRNLAEILVEDINSSNLNYE